VTKGSGSLAFTLNGSECSYPAQFSLAVTWKVVLIAVWNWT